MTTTLTDVWLYLRGDLLEPTGISNALKIEPTECQRKGEDRTTSTRKSYKTKIGLWALRAPTEGTIESRIETLVTTLEASSQTFAGLQGVDEAYLDVWVATKVSRESLPDVAIELSPAILERTAKLGLELRLTIAPMAKDDS